VVSAASPCKKSLTMLRAARCIKVEGAKVIARGTGVHRVRVRMRADVDRVDVLKYPDFEAMVANKVGPDVLPASVTGVDSTKFPSKQEHHLCASNKTAPIPGFIFNLARAHRKMWP
jgi:hypothetical protein